jgi:hypothetical protein
MGLKKMNETQGEDMPYGCVFKHSGFYFLGE